MKKDYENQVVEDDQSRFKKSSHGSAYISVEKMKEYKRYMNYRKNAESNFHIISKLIQKEEGMDMEAEDDLFAQEKKKSSRKNEMKKRLRKRAKELGLYKNDEEDWWNEKKKREQRIAEEQQQLENDVFGEDEEVEFDDELFIKEEETESAMFGRDYDEDEDLFSSGEDDETIEVSRFNVKTEGVGDDDVIFGDDDEVDEDETQLDFISPSARPRFILR
jgi:hypothetical protein